MATTVALPSFSFSNFMFGFLCGVVMFLVAIIIWANQTPGQSTPATTVPAALSACNQSQATGYTDLPTYCAAFPTDTCCTANSPQLPNTGNAGSAAATSTGASPTGNAGSAAATSTGASPTTSSYIPAPFN